MKGGKIVLSKQVSQRSHEKEFKFLIEEYATYINRLAYIYVKDWAIAEDITQDVFLKCFVKLDRFRGKSSYKTWLYKITVNKCKDYLKSKWYRNIFPTDYIKDVLLSTNRTPEHQVVANDEKQALITFILSLPSKYREVIILYYYEQLKIKEIAEITGMKQETIRTRLKRAKHILQSKYERRHFNEHESAT